VCDKNEFPVGFCFVAQAIFRIRSGRLESNLLPTCAIEAVTRPKITVKLEALHLLLQTCNLLVGLSQEVIRRFRSQLALILCSDLIGLPKDGFFGCLLGGQLYCRDGPFLCFPLASFCVLIVAPGQRCAVQGHEWVASYCCLSAPVASANHQALG